MTSLDVIGKSILAGVAFRYVSFMLSGKHLKGMGSRNVTSSIGTPSPNHPDVLSEWFTLIFGITAELKGVTKRDIL